MAVGSTGDLFLVGCGKMGGAMLSGWLDQGVAPTSITIIEPNDDALSASLQAGITRCRAADELADKAAPDIIVFAVKPQVMDEVAPPYARFAPDATFLSIAAGKTIAEFEALLGSGAAIIRVMPNTPAAVRRGISVAAANGAVNAKARARAVDLLNTVGEVAWIEDEGLMDAVTALSGSGPAYVFHLTACMTKAGIRAGLPEDLARQLARATVAGSGALMVESGEAAEQLRRNVTSPGGTTEAALAVLMEGNAMQKLLTKAILAATNRSRKLAG
ncbi:MAG: pyrroline-5-carboxylate reductase [Pseudomonadota bacterium]|nr:pyrroline-5-carboxylate reductase [Pseudomonadota bacterium]